MSCKECKGDEKCEGCLFEELFAQVEEVIVGALETYEMALDAAIEKELRDVQK